MPYRNPYARPKLSSLLVALLVTAITTRAPASDVIYADSFEGFALLGGSISGTVWTDPNGDGDPVDGEPLAGKTIYLDADYDGRLDDGEPTVTSGADGFYRFAGVPAGVHHVRQVLEPPATQTLPGAGIPPDHDRLPDEVYSYTHAAPGGGNFDVPYGIQPSSYPPEWPLARTGALPEIIDSVDMVLQPIGVRDRIAGVSSTFGSGVLTLPLGSQITLRFDETVVDGDGPDLIVFSDRVGGGEQAEIRIGPAPDALLPLAVVDEDDANSFPLDLADAGLTGPVRYLQIVPLDNVGSWFGFEFVGVEVLNFAAADPGAHIVVVTPQEFDFEDRDFARDADDLAPTLAIGAVDGNPATTGFRQGETIEVQLFANDDVGVSSVSLTVNGTNIALDGDNSAAVVADRVGRIAIEAAATDTAGQTTLRNVEYTVLNADGSQPFDSGVTGPGFSDSANAPRLSIVSPDSGENLSTDISVVAQITDDDLPLEWTLEYASIDDVDPFNLSFDDPDYAEAASGSGNVYSSSIGTIPLESLPDGVYFIRLTATDGNGESAGIGRVIGKNVPAAGLRPQITIDGPSAGTEVFLTSDITGTIESTRPLQQWFVEYAPADQVDRGDLGSETPEWIRLSEGDSPVPTSDVLANFDATMLENNGYIVRVVAFNDIGLGRVEGVELSAVGEAKLGRNRLVFTDIEIELSGFPLRLERVYDSMRAERPGQLGYGWSLGLADAEVDETVPDTGTVGVFGATPFRVGAQVYLNAPDGQRLRFTFNPQPGTPTALGTPYRARFDGDPGVAYELEAPEGDQEFLAVNDDGNVYLFGFAFPYNPDRYVLVAPDGKRYTIHEDEGLLAAEDLNGNTLSFNQDGIRHSSGSALEFVRDPQGRIAEIRDPEGNAWLYTYDAQGNLAAYTDPDGDTTVYSYLSDPAHYLSIVEDPQGRMPRRYEYDPASGRLQAVIDENGNRREVLYDPQGFTGTRADARGNIFIYDYDERGNITRIEDPKGNVALYEYNDPQNPDRATRFIDNNGQTWETEYDDAGRPVTLYSPTAAGTFQRIDVEYDALGNILEYNDYDSRQSTYAYDERGNRTEEAPFDGLRSEFARGARGEVLRKTFGGDFEVNYGYDELGHLGSQTDTLGFQLTLENLENGRLSRRIDDRGTLDVDFTPAGKLSTQTDTFGNTASLIENPDGSLTRTDRTGRVSTLDYDADGRPVALELPGGGAITTRYDADGNPESVTDPLGNTTTYAFDSTNNLTSITDALGQADTFAVDAVGNIVEIVDRNGKRRTFEWDANQRMTVERWHDAGGTVIREITFNYSLGSGLASVDDASAGLTFSLSYVGRLPRPSRVDYVLPGQAPWSVNYTWSDEARQPETISIRSSGSVDLSWIGVDEYGGRVWGLEWWHPDADDQNVRLLRNADGRLRRIERDTKGDDAFEIFTEIERDALGDPSRILHFDALDALLHPEADRLYTRDEEGRLLTDQSSNNTVGFSYDDNGQLTAATHANPAYTDESYGYDAAGNRLESHLTPGPATIAAGNRITSAGVFSYAYDNAGNWIRRTNTATGRVVEFEYDHRNRMNRATTHPSLGAPADNVLQFEYDYRDRLLFRVVNGQKTWVLRDRDQPVAEFGDGATTLSAAYLYDPSVLDHVLAIWRDDGVETRWLLHDQLGSVRGVADPDGLVLSWLDYDAFGNLQPGSVQEPGVPLGFASRPWIPEIGLYDNRRRFYDPVLGRFTQEDPIRHRGRDFNFYRYAFNAPTEYTDPTGTVSATTMANIVQAINYAIEVYQGADSLGFPCTVASSVATTFVYFDWVSDIFIDPSAADNQPALDRNDLLELTGCNTQ